MQSDLFEPGAPWQRTRRDDPDTSLEAAVSLNVTQQARRVLTAYSDGEPRLDWEACRDAGLAQHQWNGQRCSDLRHNGLIERTGDKGRTPSGRRGYYCKITPKGVEFLGSVSAGCSA